MSRKQIIKRKTFGQHFLVDRGVCQRIVDAFVTELEFQEGEDKAVLEIGPGKKAITDPLVQSLAHVAHLSSLTLVEKDRVLAADLAFKPLPFSAEVICEDFLDLANEDWEKKDLAVISNLPYSSGTAILDRLVRSSQVSFMVLMFQKEVAQRVRAAESSKHRGSLSVWVQNRFDVSPVLKVGPKSFRPPPKVDSEVILLKRRAQHRIAVQDAAQEELFEKMIRASFAHRRKMLRSFFPWKSALEQSGVDGRKRAEALDWEEWDKLFQAVKALT